MCSPLSNKSCSQLGLPDPCHCHTSTPGCTAPQSHSVHSRSPGRWPLLCLLSADSAALPALARPASMCSIWLSHCAMLACRLVLARLPGPAEDGVPPPCSRALLPAPLLLPGAAPSVGASWLLPPMAASAAKCSACSNEDACASSAWLLCPEAAAEPTCRPGEAPTEAAEASCSASARDPGTGSVYCGASWDSGGGAGPCPLSDCRSCAGRPSVPAAVRRPEDRTAAAAGRPLVSSASSSARSSGVSCGAGTMPRPALLRLARLALLALLRRCCARSANGEMGAAPNWACSLLDASIAGSGWLPKPPSPTAAAVKGDAAAAAAEGSAWSSALKGC